MASTDDFDAPEETVKWLVDPGLVVSLATWDAIAAEVFPQEMVGELSAAEWADYGHEVWESEKPDGCPAVTMEVVDAGLDRAPVSGADSCAQADWVSEEGDLLQAPYSELPPGTPLIRATPEGLNRLDVLHEVTHLTCDLRAPEAPGHRWAFAQNFARLLETWVSPEAAVAWKMHFERRVLAAPRHTCESLLAARAEGERLLRERDESGRKRDQSAQ